MMPKLPPPFAGLYTADDMVKYARAVAEACAAIVDEHRGPIEIYNKRYPAFFECAKEIREAAKEIGK